MLQEHGLDIVWRLCALGDSFCLQCGRVIFMDRNMKQNVKSGYYTEAVYSLIHYISTRKYAQWWIYWFL